MADYAVELLVDGAWQDITADVRDSDPIKISRGRRDWAAVADPATCTLKLNNGASRVSAGQFGRYSPRNPRSDLYGKISRNTRLRVRRRNVARASYMELGGTIDPYAYATTPSHSSFNAAGDLEVRVDIEPHSWRPDSTEGVRGIARHWLTTGDQRAWAIRLYQNGYFRFTWSPDGTFGSAVNGDAGAPVPAVLRRAAVRVVLDVDNGAGGYTVTWSYASSVDAPEEAWTALGTPATGSGTTSVYAADAPIEIGRTTPSGIAADPYAGRVYAFQLRRAGVLRADADFRALEPETTSFTDSVGRPWSLVNAPIITSSIRFSGEVSAWPPEWDLSGADQWVPITASGISRRLQRGTKPLKSSLFRDLSVKPGIVAYWPMEDPTGATRYAAGRANDTSFLRPKPVDEVTPAADADTFPASAPLPTVRVGTIYGTVPTYEGADDQRFFCLVGLPSEAYDTDRIILRILTSGSLARWDIISAAGNGVRLQVYDVDGTQVLNRATINGLHGSPAMVSLWLGRRGSDTFWQVFRLHLDGRTHLIEDTLSGTIDRITHVYLGSTNDVEGAAFGHATILNGDVHSIWDNTTQALRAWAGETGAARLQRLAIDEGLPPVHIIGDGRAAEIMGPQRLLTLIELLREVPTADLGTLTDRADALGYTYRTRATLYNQNPKLVLDYRTGVVDAPFRMVDDDQATRNDITVDRVRGSSYTARAETGPLSIQDPPDGVGVYDYSQEINIDSDDRLPAQAGWRLRLGTVDGARYPRLRVNLRNPRVEPMTDDVLAVAEGDVIRIENLPDSVPPGPVDLIVDALVEEKTAVTHSIEFTCAPAESWTVFRLGDDVLGRLDTAGSTLALGVDEDDTTMVVATQSGSQPWIEFEDGEDTFDITIGGETMTVTAIAGDHTPQTFTVIRSRNGIVKTQTAGTAVRLASRHAVAL